MNPANPPQASWILIKQSHIKAKKKNNKTHPSLASHHGYKPITTNQNQHHYYKHCHKHQEKEREWERERNRDRQGRERTRRRQDRRDNSGGEISFKRRDSLIPLSLKLTSHHHQIKKTWSPPSPQTHYPLPTSTNNQSQITICIKLSGDHHGRKKNLKHVWRKRRWVWLCGFGCWFCLMWSVRFSGDWVCWDRWVWLVIGYVGSVVLNFWIDLVLCGFRIWWFCCYWENDDFEILKIFGFVLLLFLFKPYSDLN